MVIDMIKVELNNTLFIISSVILIRIVSFFSSSFALFCSLALSFTISCALYHISFRNIHRKKMRDLDGKLEDKDSWKGTKATAKQTETHMTISSEISQNVDKYTWTHCFLCTARNGRGKCRRLENWWTGRAPNELYKKVEHVVNPPETTNKKNRMPKWRKKRWIST